MPARYLLDTNICVYIRRRRPPEVLVRFESLQHGEAVISVITHGELRYGAEMNPEREKALGVLDRFTELVPVEPLPARTAAAYGSIRSILERRGQVIGNNDIWIAAHAATANLVLVTNNEREFNRVPGLKIENWISAN